jgi:hypothetical protein
MTKPSVMRVHESNTEFNPRINELGQFDTTDIVAFNLDDVEQVKRYVDSVAAGKPLRVVYESHYLGGFRNHFWSLYRTEEPRRGHLQVFITASPEEDHRNCAACWNDFDGSAGNATPRSESYGMPYLKESMKREATPEELERMQG